MPQSCTHTGLPKPTRYRPEAGFAQINRSAPEHGVPNGGFSFDVKLKSFGSSINQTRIQYQPPSLVRYFSPRDDGTFSAPSRTVQLQCVMRSLSTPQSVGTSSSVK
jgi:hypothetical protein